MSDIRNQNVSSPELLIKLQSIVSCKISYLEMEFILGISYQKPIKPLHYHILNVPTQSAILYFLMKITFHVLGEGRQLCNCVQLLENC